MYAHFDYRDDDGPQYETIIGRATEETNHVIDEMATTETETETETFDLEAAIAAHIAERDQRQAAENERREQEARDSRAAFIADSWTGVCEAFTPAQRAALGITGPEQFEDYQGNPTVLSVTIDGEPFRIVCSRRDFDLSAPRGVMRDGWIHTTSFENEVFSRFIALVAQYREWKAAREANSVVFDADDETTTRTKAAKTWEPQVLGSDGYRTTYLLDVDVGCGSITQHVLTVAEISMSGDVIVSHLFPGRVSRYGEGEGAPKAAVEYRLSGAQLRALWPVWQQVTAKSQENLADTEATDAGVPF